MKQLKHYFSHPVPFRRHLFVVLAIFAIVLSAANVYLYVALTIDVELLSARHHLDKVAEELQQDIRLSRQGEVKFDANTYLYIGEQYLPQSLSKANKLPLNQPREFDTEISSQPFYMMRVLLPVDDEPTDVFIRYYDESYEAIEDELISLQKSQLLMSFGLLLLSLLALLHISSRLTRPLTRLADELSNRPPSDLTPVSPVKPQAPSELGQLVDSVNQYQDQNSRLLERERAFNRYASHELRTPLMVMQGAANLLKHSDNPAFVAKQRERILDACREMNDFVTTLLSLSREEQQDSLCQRSITEQEVNAIVADHLHLIQDKSVQSKICVEQMPQVIAPESTVKILLGNLVKNAFAHTEHGEVIVTLRAECITVSDTGSGLGRKPAGVKGYGLGLLIANDICRKYGWLLTLSDRPEGGCVARVVFSDE